MRRRSMPTRRGSASRGRLRFEGEAKRRVVVVGVVRADDEPAVPVTDVDERPTLERPAVARLARLDSYLRERLPGEHEASRLLAVQFAHVAQHRAIAVFVVLHGLEDTPLAINSQAKGVSV